MYECVSVQDIWDGMEMLYWECVRAHRISDCMYVILCRVVVGWRGLCFFAVVGSESLQGPPWISGVAEDIA